MRWKCGKFLHLFPFYFCDFLPTAQTLSLRTITHLFFRLIIYAIHHLTRTNINVWIFFSARLWYYVGLLSWNVLDCGVDLEEELNNLTSQAPEGEIARHGERLIQFASENLVTEILIHPQYNTLIQCMRNLLSSFTRHRHIIHSGYTFSGNGSWILQVIVQFSFKIDLRYSIRSWQMYFFLYEKLITSILIGCF